MENTIFEARWAKAKEYHLIEKNDAEDFNKEINVYLEDNWKLYGETKITMQPRLAIGTKKDTFSYQQILVR